MKASYLASKEFWYGAAERAIRSFAWAMMAALLVPNVDASLGFDVLNVGWADAASLAVGASALSLLGSIAAGPIGPEGSPSLVDDKPPANLPAADVPPTVAPPG